MKKTALTTGVLMAFISLFFGVLVFSAQESEPGFESVPIMLKSSDLLPADIMSGDNYRLEETVKNDGLINTYQLTTNYGPMEMESTEALLMRINELNALHHMEQLKQTSAFKDALVKGAKAPFYTAKGLVTEPVTTVKGVGSGMGQWFSNIGRSAVSKDPHQEGVASAVVGYAGVRRQYAYEYGINPYTGFGPLQKELRAISKASVAGGLTPSVAFAALKSPVGTALGASKTADTMRKLVRDTPPEKLKKINREKLLAMNVSDELTDAFLNNYVFDPQEATFLVGALESMADVDGRWLLIELASLADEEAEAKYIRIQSQMIADYHTRVSPVERFTIVKGSLFVERKDGVVLGLFPLDYVAWTEPLAKKEEAVSEYLTSELALKEKELWVLGTIDPAAQEALKARGWTLEEKVGAKLGWK